MASLPAAHAAPSPRARPAATPPLAGLVPWGSNATPRGGRGPSAQPRSGGAAGARSAWSRGVAGAGAGMAAWLAACGGAHAFSVADLDPRRLLFRSGGKRVLILMSDTGGGHRASAEAIKAGFRARHGRAFDVEFVDLWADHTPWPFNALPSTYSFLVKHSALWRASYYGQQPRAVHRTTLALSGAAMDKLLAACFDAHDPDLVVSVHPLMQQVPLSVLARRAKRASATGVGPRARPPPFATVVTDLTTCHNTWFDGRVDACFVPTPECAARARRMGVPVDKTVMHGLPIRPVFGAVPGSKTAVRKRLGMAAHLPTVLIVGGGEGMGAMKATVDALAVAAPPAGLQIVAVCGRNAALKADLDTAPWPPHVRVVATGFVSNMEEWMAAADVVATKAGPGTIAEAITSGLPLLLTGFIPCQEAGNVPFVVGRGCGSFERNPQRAAATLARWLAPDGAPALAAMRDAVARVAAGWEGALDRIVDDLAALCRTGRLPPGAALQG